MCGGLTKIKMTAHKTIEILRHIFASYGLPAQLVSDNGPQFIAKEFEEFMFKNGIKHITSAPYHPATNGLIKRFVQSFKREMEAGKKKWANVATQILHIFVIS